MAPAISSLMKTHRIVFVNLIHPSIRLILRDDLSDVFHDDLARPEAPIRPNAVATVWGFEDLYANVEGVFGSSPLAQSLELAIATPFRAHVANHVIAFIKHQAVLTILVTSSFWLADTLG